MVGVKLRVTGRERKEVARLISHHFGVSAVYQGAPGFGYLVTEPGGREWHMDKTGTVGTQVAALDNADKVFTVLKTLKECGADAEGRMSVTISTEGHSGVTLRNLVNILAAKEWLIAKATGINMSQ